jgi:hypothetical protein
MAGQQTSVSYASRRGIPGQIADINDCLLVTAVCTTTVLPGTYVELALAADGETLICNSPASTVATLAEGGVACYSPGQDPNALPAIGSVSGISGTGFPVGTPITVLRRGRVFVQCDAASTAGNATLFLAANVQHPSSTAASATNVQGQFTVVATNTTAGTETTAAPGYQFFRIANAGVALMEVNRGKTA